jgi:hypothetical protein
VTYGSRNAWLSRRGAGVGMRGLRWSMVVPWLSGAHGALLRAVGREAGLASDRPRRGDRARDVRAGAEVHLVGRLAAARRVGVRPAVARPHRVAPSCRRKDVEAEHFSPGRARLGPARL